MKEFYTREAANKGVELPLYLPDGTKSKHYLVVRGTDADSFRREEARAKRNAIGMAQIDSIEEREDAVQELELRCLASLIVDWSFEQKMTTESIIAFFKEAPQIAEAVNLFSAKRANFILKKPTNSADG